MSDRLTLEQLRVSLASYVPRGSKVWGAAHFVGSVFFLLLRGLSTELGRVEKAIQLYRQHQIPDVTILYLEEWEKALGIPDDCFLKTGDEAERLRDVRAKLASLGVQSSDDFVALAALFGFTVIVEGGIGSILYPGGFSSDKEARNTIVVTFDVANPNSFPYTFPITFEQNQTAIVECLFTKLKPITNDIRFLYV